MEQTDGHPEDRSAETLLPENVVQDFRNQWSNVQSGFVDEPQAAVRQADELVAVAMKRLAEGFTDQRNTLEHQWSGSKDVSTEDLRVALRSIGPSSNACWPFRRRLRKDSRKQEMHTDTRG